MTYSQLRAFHNVARYGGFSKAAEQMHQSQPVLSGHIKELEKICIKNINKLNYK